MDRLNDGGGCKVIHSSSPAFGKLQLTHLFEV